jgi:hypothetical protein
MRISASFTVTAIVAAVLLAGCGGNAAPHPALASGASAALGTASVARPGVALRHGIALGAHAIRPNPCCVQTLFVSDVGANAVQLYQYPNGTYQGQLPPPTLPAAPFNQPQGECVDVTNPQHVFIANTSASTIDEYTHSGAFVAQLSDSGEYPVSCAFRQTTNATSGVLAVGNIETIPGPFGGNISVYTETNGVWTGPTIHNPPGAGDWRVFFVDYKGTTLYLDATHYSGQFAFLRMSPGGAFTQIALSGAPCFTVNFPGGVQQVGSYLAVGDQLPNAGCPNILHVLPSGAVIGSTTLSPSPSDLAQFTRKGTRIVGPDISGSPPNADIYSYGSGSLLTPITSPLVAPIGSAISHQ